MTIQRHTLIGFGRYIEIVREFISELFIDKGLSCVIEMEGVEARCAFALCLFLFCLNFYPKVLLCFIAYFGGRKIFSSVFLLS